MRITDYDGKKYFTGWAGLDLFFDERRPDDTDRASVIIVHGYAEHSGRYSAVADMLVEEGFSVFFYDQRGHGRSEGVRADVLRFADYVRDLTTFVDYVRERSNGHKVFAVAHSTGAAASVLYAVSDAAGIDGLVTTGIYVRDAAEYDKWKIVLGKVLVHFVPLMPIQELDSTRVAADPEACKAFRDDPLVYHGAARVRMGMHLVNLESYLKEAFRRIALPLLILHGANDRLASVEGSKTLYSQAVSEDKGLEILDGTGHAVLHDFNWKDTCRSISEWMKARI